MIQIISVASELGAGTRGSSLGMDAVMMASLKTDPAFFKRHPIEKVKTSHKWLLENVNNPYGKRIRGIANIYRRLAIHVDRSVKMGRFPLVFSGDHSSAGGTIAGLSQAYTGKRLGIIWIDAHADLHSPYTSPSGNVHGMPLATAISDDNLDCAINKPKKSTVKNWNKMKGTSRRIVPSDLVFIGLRSTEVPEEHLIEKHGMKVIRTEEVRKSGVNEVVKQSLQHLAECDIIYVSFDVDSMDPSVSIGTGTPVPEGLTEAEARELLVQFAGESRLCGVEFTEVNPLLDDKGNAMAEAAFRCLSAFMEAYHQK